MTLPILRSLLRLPTSGSNSFWRSALCPTTLLTLATTGFASWSLFFGGIGTWFPKNSTTVSARRRTIPWKTATVTRSNSLIRIGEEVSWHLRCGVDLKRFLPSPASGDNKGLLSGSSETVGAHLDAGLWTHKHPNRNIPHQRPPPRRCSPDKTPPSRCPLVSVPLTKQSPPVTSKSFESVARFASGLAHSNCSSRPAPPAAIHVDPATRSGSTLQQPLREKPRRRSDSGRG